MIVNTDFLEGARTLFQSLFDQMFGEAPNQWQIIATQVNSENKEKVTFNWLGAPPMLREFTGAVEFGKAFPHEYTITMTPQAVGIEISKWQFEHDSLGNIALFVQNFMSHAAKYKDFITFTQLTAGFNSLCFDGKTFYAANHKFGDSSTFDNVDTRALSADDPTAYNDGYAEIATAQDDSGHPMSLVPSHLVHNPKIRYIVRKLLKATVIDSTTNVLQDDVIPVQSAYAGTTTQPGHWHLLACNEPIKPTLMIVDKEPEFLAQDGIESDKVFNFKVFSYQVEAALKTGFGDPRTAFGSDGTG